MEETMRFRLIPTMTAAVLALGIAAADAKTVINVAYENNPGEPVDKVIHYWADLLKEKSKGEIELVLFPSSQLGSKKDVTEQAMMGVNVITITDVGYLQDYDPDLGILFGPYLTENPQKLFKIYEGP
jgi:TRAP-type C4-dicarboxylate transport system substrate-binding protein